MDSINVMPLRPVPGRDCNEVRGCLPEEDGHMKRFLASLAFVLVYACGVLIAWNTPGIANNLTPIFAIAWVFATNKIVSWMVKKAGWDRNE